MLLALIVSFVILFFLWGSSRNVARKAREWEAEVNYQMRLNLERAERIERLIREEEAHLADERYARTEESPGITRLRRYKVEISKGG
jgi:hypothetical protein